MKNIRSMLTVAAASAVIVGAGMTGAQAATNCTGELAVCATAGTPDLGAAAGANGEDLNADAGANVGDLGAEAEANGKDLLAGALAGNGLFGASASADGQNQFAQAEAYFGQLKVAVDTSVLGKLKIPGLTEALNSLMAQLGGALKK